MPIKNPERDLLLRIIDDAFDHRGWQGPVLRGVLRGITAERAAWRPERARHSIWDLVLHCAYWKYAAWRRLTGARRGSFARKGSNWFESPAPDEKAWRNDLAALADWHRQLRAAIANASPATLRAKSRLIYGVAAHDVYHTGQIQILKRLQGI